VRVLELPAGKSPREWGRIHGESFRGEIKALAEIRIYLCTKVGGFATRDQVLAAARAHVPVLERYDAALYAELAGIAEGAAVTPEDIVVANHYTDLRDLDPDPKTWQPAPEDPGGCSVIFAETRSGRVVAQTWDMHATAIPYVMALVLPDATLLTVTGCLGMAGMNRSRVAIAINNLFSTDATLGVVWPAMVRRALREPTAIGARDLIVRSPIGSGHHYFVADRTHAFGIEASGTRRKVVYDRDPDRDDDVPARYFHTNHALDPDIAAASKVPQTSTTYDRMRHLEDGRTAKLDGLDDAWRALGSEDGWPKSVCTNMATPEAPHGAATCGAIAMNLDSGEVWAQQGLIHNVAAEKFHV
jgi:isopenicillin-N N-acyltransferase-like protein